MLKVSRAYICFEYNTPCILPTSNQDMNGFQLGFGVYYLIYVLRFSEVAFDKLQGPGARFFTTVMGMTQFVMSAAMFLMTALFPDDRDFRFHCSIWLSVALLYPLVISVCKFIVSSDRRHQ